MSKKIIKRIYNVVIILLFLGAIGWCFSHFYHGSDVAYTDDAQVRMSWAILLFAFLMRKS